MVERLIQTAIKKCKRKIIRSSFWGSGTFDPLLGRAITSRPERTAFVTKELQWYQIDIVLHSAKPGLPMKVPTSEEGGGYTFFWKGKPQADDRIHGEGFVIRTALIKSLSVLPVGINKCLLKLCIPPNKPRHPMLTSTDDTKDQFCKHLDQIIPEWQTRHPWRFRCQSRKRLQWLGR